MTRNSLLLLFLVSVAVVISGCSSSPSHTASPPSDRFIYVASYTPSTVQLPSVLSALNAGTGKTLWRFQLPNVGITTPVPASDVVYVGATDQSVYAFTSATGQKRWQARIGGFPTVEAVMAGAVYVLASHNTAASEDNAVYALNAGTGEVLWHTDLLQGVVKAIAAGKIYVETFTQGAITFYALDARNGQRLWQYQIMATSDHWQLVDGQIYDLASPSHDVLTSVLFVVSGSTGKLLWRFPTVGETVIQSLQVADSQVYMIHGGNASSTTSAMLSAFDAHSGAVRWHGPPLTEYTSLVGASSGIVYVGTRSALVALNGRDGAQAWRSSLGDGGPGSLALSVNIVPGALYANVPGQGLVAFNTSDGSVSWRYPVDTLALFQVSTASEGVLYARLEESNPVRHQVLALNSRDGKLIWSYDPGEPVIQLVAG